MKYLINLTFYAGSDDKEDTDRGMYLIETDKTMSEDDIKIAISNVNMLCNIDYTDYDSNEEIVEMYREEGQSTIADLVEQNPDFEFCYAEDGLNIDTLTGALEQFLSCKIEPIANNTKDITADAVYTIEQWQ